MKPPDDEEEFEATYDKMAVEMDGTTVRIVFSCRDAYATMLLYDSIVLSCRNGDFQLDVTVNEAKD